MEYSPAKKICILLNEYKKEKDNPYLEKEILACVDEDINDYELYKNQDEVLEMLSDWYFKNIDEVISYLSELSCVIGEAQCERGIAQAERMREYEYENGMDYVMTHGYDF